MSYCSEIFCECCNDANQDNIDYKEKYNVALGNAQHINEDDGKAIFEDPIQIPPYLRKENKISQSNIEENNEANINILNCISNRYNQDINLNEEIVNNNEYNENINNANNNDVHSIETISENHIDTTNKNENIVRNNIIDINKSKKRTNNMANDQITSNIEQPQKKKKNKNKIKQTKSYKDIRKTSIILQKNDIKINDLNGTRSIKYTIPNNLSNKYFDADNNINQEVNNKQNAHLNTVNDMNLKG